MPVAVSSLSLAPRHSGLHNSLLKIVLYIVIISGCESGDSSDATQDTTAQDTTQFTRARLLEDTATTGSNTTNNNTVTPQPGSTAQFFDKFTEKEKIIGGAIVGGGVLLGGAVGGLVGGLIGSNSPSGHRSSTHNTTAPPVCETTLRSDHMPGSNLLDVSAPECFNIGDTIVVANESREIVGFSSIVLDRPIAAYIKKGSIVQARMPLTTAASPKANDTTVVTASNDSNSTTVVTANTTYKETDEMIGGMHTTVVVALSLVGAICLVVIICAAIACFMRKKPGKKFDRRKKPGASKILNDSRQVKLSSSNDHLSVAETSSYEEQLPSFTPSFQGQSSEYSQSSWSPPVAYAAPFEQQVPLYGQQYAPYGQQGPPMLEYQAEQQPMMMSYGVYQPEQQPMMAYSQAPPLMNAYQPEQQPMMMAYGQAAQMPLYR